MYKIHFKFFDDHAFSIEVADDMLDQVLDDLGKNKPSFNEDKSKGFWLQGEQVRYFYIEKAGDEPCQQKQNSEAVLDLKH